MYDTDRTRIIFRFINGRRWQCGDEMRRNEGS